MHDIKRYNLITADEVKRLVGYLLKCQPPLMACDLETTGLDPHKDSISGLSLCWSEAGPAVWVSRANLPEFLELLKPALETIPLVNHNGIGFDDPFLREAGINAHFVHDTLVLAYASGWWSELLGKKGGIGLKSLTSEVLDYKMVTLEEVFAAQGKPFGDFSTLDPNDPLVVRYTTDDAWCAFRLFQALQKDTRPGVQFVYDLERALVPVSAEIEATGIALDTAYLAEQRIRLGHIAHTVRRWLLDSVGLPNTFNLGSPEQLAKLLFVTWKLPIQGYAGQKKGTPAKARKKPPQPVTDEATIEVLRNKCGDSVCSVKPGHRAILDDWLGNLLVYKGLEKNLGTYIDGLPAKADASGTLRTKYHQFGTSTGRFSSSSPNLQNITRSITWETYGSLRDIVGTIKLDVRRALAARPGHYFIQTDYAAIEARIMASGSRDPNYLRVFTSGGDIHTNIAAQINGVEVGEVDKEMRQRTKTVVYGWQYGQEKEGLSKRNNLAPAIVSKLLRGIRTTFSVSVRWREDKIAEWYTRKGWAYSYFGRGRYLPTYNSPNRGERAGGERQAFNHYIQGTAGDIQKMAILRLHKRLKKAFAGMEDPPRIVMHTHDDNVVEVPDSIPPEQVLPIIKEAMDIRIKGWLPFAAESKIRRHLGAQE
jgi:DNA polymerase-1